MKSVLNFHIAATFPIVLLGIFQANAQEVYTEKEMAILSEFRQLVKSHLTKDYMKEDAFLIKWLEAQKFNLIDSRAMFENAIEWRKQNEIDNILKEDFYDIFKRAPYSLDGIDYKGRPVLTFNPGRWDIRRFILNREGPRLSRFLDQMLESMRARIVQLAESSKNITQGVTIIDVGGYNIRQHGCLQCVGPLLNWVRHYESYYPGMLSDFHLVNNPRIFSPLLELVKPLFSPATAKILKVHGPDKEEWSKEILKTIPANQLSPQYGGTKIK